MKLLKSVDVDTLMASFLTIYLDERSAVEKALQRTMEDDDKEDLIDFFFYKDEVPLSTSEERYEACHRTSSPQSDSAEL